MRKANGLLALLMFAIALVSAAGALAQKKPLPAEVTDATATESLKNWNKHYVPSLKLSDDAKVGKHCVFGDFGFTQNAIFRAGEKKTWDLTQYGKMRFWAKADKKNDNLLVMLMTNGFKHRRDAVVGLTTEWNLYELPFTLKRFNKNVQGKFSFSSVQAVSFYQNSAGKTKIWIDGLEFVRRKVAPAMKAESFGKPPKQMAGWAFFGKCSSAKVKRQEGIDTTRPAAQTCLAIDGCGFGESPKLPVDPSRAYRISGWGKTDGDVQNNACLKIKWFDAQANVVYWEFVRRNFFTRDWRRYEKVAIVPAGATHVSAVCHAQAMWGKNSYFTEVAITPVAPPMIRCDMRFDRIEEEWFNDRSPCRNDGEAFCLKNEDIIVSQDGGAANFQNRKAKVRLYHSQALACSSDEWVMALQFFPEEPMFEAPEGAHFTLIDSDDYYIQYRKEKARTGKKTKDGKDEMKTVFNLVVLFRTTTPKGQSSYSFVSMPIELFKWYRLVVKIDKARKRLETELLIDGDKVVKRTRDLNGTIGTRCPIFFVGCKDFPRASRRAWPWGLWGRMDYIKIYDSFAAYEADRPNLRYGGFGK